MEDTKLIKLHETLQKLQPRGKVGCGLLAGGSSFCSMQCIDVFGCGGVEGGVVGM